MFATLKKYGLIVSRLPVVQSGLLTIMKDHFPEYEVSAHQQIEELTLLHLRKANLVLVDLEGPPSSKRRQCEHYYSLMVRYQEIHWVFMVNEADYPLAIEYLLRPESTLLSDAEPIPCLIRAIQERGKQAGNLSAALISPEAYIPAPTLAAKVSLTLSERQVLRLLAKGWGVNQIAMLLRKSNKTISAQKNSAMRRLALRGNAEMYAWINSAQGMKELNLLPTWGESTQWKNVAQADMSLS
ncbi:DNA-binding response regulator [Enterobacteriaceae bacterium 89]|jgi:DNA-binding NarL/FixJ family response regulator|nr:DNA-binding response regulator [Enterobacteriaceae bacterium 89]